VALNPGLADGDMDGISNTCDKCPGTQRKTTIDSNGCTNSQVDGDGDNVCDPGASPSTRWCTRGMNDNCPLVPNTNQADSNGNGVGDACEIPESATMASSASTVPEASPSETPSSPESPAPVVGPCGMDSDGDLVGDQCDNCKSVYNADQSDLDSDGVGDACDST
jgi:hypothetical protein